MIVIPMAGESSRFRKAGYAQPKYMLPLYDRPLFDWAVLSFASSFASERFLFVVRDTHATPAFVEARATAMGIARFDIVVLDAPTSGQAETVEVGLARHTSTGDDEPLTIFNIDTIRPNAIVDSVPGTSGWLEVFRVPGDNWSFITLDPDDPARVARCTEKQRISDLCCTGLYQFGGAAAFLGALEAERAKPSSHELFVAPLYNHLIARGARIGWREVATPSVILSGVPDEYHALLAALPDAMRAMVEPPADTVPEI